MEKYFNLKKDEEIITTMDNIIVMANENKIIANIIITTKRIVLLQDINKQLVSNSNLQSKGVYIPPEYEMIYELNLLDILKMSYESNCNVLILKNKNYLKIYCSNFIKYLSNCGTKN